MLSRVKCARPSEGPGPEGLSPIVAWRSAQSTPFRRLIRPAARDDHGEDRLKAALRTPPERRDYVPSPPQAVAKAARRLGLPIGEQKLSAAMVSSGQPSAVSGQQEPHASSHEHPVSSIQVGRWRERLGERRRLAEGRVPSIQHPVSSIRYEVFGGGLGDPPRLLHASSSPASTEPLSREKTHARPLTCPSPAA